MRRRVRLHLCLGLLGALALGVLAGWWRDARPVELADAPDARLECLSYAPSSVGAAGAAGELTPARIRFDLARLSALTGCVRTYSVGGGLDAVPGIAREFGMRVWLGAWIGRDPGSNERELARVVDVALRHRDVVRGIVVGNEVLLRHEQTPAALAAMLRRVRTATGMPVTYADVWGFWIKHPQLAREVSFVTVHILPFWDDDPVGIDAVVPRVMRLYEDLRRRFPGRELLIGETGWPSAGRPRGAAVPSVVNQARYLREFVAAAHARAIPYNVIEAFDQPWKRAPEGTVGGYWGVLDAIAQPKFPWRGPVRESAAAPRVLQWAGALALVGFGAGWGLGRRARFATAMLLGAAGALVGTIGPRQWQALAAANLTIVDWVATLAVAAGGWIAFGYALRQAGRFAADDALVNDVPAAAEQRAPAPRATLPPPLALGLLLAAAYACLGLVFAGRYRDFPVWLFLPAVAAAVMLAVLDPRAVARGLTIRRASLELLLGTWVAVAGLLLPLLESWGSGRAIAFGASMLALGLAVVGPVALEARRHGHAGEHAER